MIQIPIEQNRFQAVNTSAETVLLDGEQVLRVNKTEKIDEPDENTYAKVRNLTFHNGTIEVKMRSRLLPDAPAHARGFIGITFRGNDDDSYFESFYVRPTNGTTDDPVRKAHGCQYFAYPTYTFSYFRERGITQYEAPIDFGLDQWVTLKAVIQGERADFYINGADTPLLSVEKLLHGTGEPGSVGLFVDIGTDGFFKDLKITPV